MHNLFAGVLAIRGLLAPAALAHNSIASRAEFIAEQKEQQSPADAVAQQLDLWCSLEAMEAAWIWDSADAFRRRFVAISRSDVVRHAVALADEAARKDKLGEAQRALVRAFAAQAADAPSREAAESEARVRCEQEVGPEVRAHLAR